MLEQVTELRYRIEQSRGYDWKGNLWSPGCFSVNLAESSSASLVISTEQWYHVNALSPENAFAAETERRRRPHLEPHAASIAAAAMKTRSLRE